MGVLDNAESRLVVADRNHYVHLLPEEADAVLGELSRLRNSHALLVKQRDKLRSALRSAILTMRSRG